MVQTASTHQGKPLFSNKVDLLSEHICTILAGLAHHIHPKIVEHIQTRNRKDYYYFKGLFDQKVDIEPYLFDGSACIFPGVRRYISGKGKTRTYNLEYRAIIDSNEFPKHIWCFLSNGKTYNGPNWKRLNFNQFELAHIFSHKESELTFENSCFDTSNNSIKPYGAFTCAANVVLLPKGTVRPTDNSETIKTVFFKRYIDLYGEAPLDGRSGFINEHVPEWYNNLHWNPPVLPDDWQARIDALLEYRTKRITDLLEKHPAAS